MGRIPTYRRWACALVALLLLATPCLAQRERILLPNEQGSLQIRDTGDYAPAPLPATTTPPTISTMAGLPEWELSLDEAIRIALQNTDVVRVLSGVGAASSGQTIYAPGIANAAIDQARATFDPTISIRNNFLRSESPSASFDPLDPNRAVISGSRADDYDFSFDLGQRFLSGADASLGVATSRSRFRPGVFPLNPRSTSAVDFTITQPLLQGRGTAVNSAPIVLAFLDTQSSYFRLKNSLQNMVAGVIQGYWDLVQARMELWVLEQQVIQTAFVFQMMSDRKDIGLASSPEVAQANASLSNFRANVIAAKTAVLDRMASLKGVLGLPPGSDAMIIPTTPLRTEQIEFDWDALIALAADKRPDIIELKLILEADQQQILQARNQSQPQLDAVAFYRWNGLEGEMPIGAAIEAEPGQHTDWSLSVNFSVPFTMRAARASLRRTELLLASDHASLRQGLLRASHSIANVLRSVEQLYRQREEFYVARKAAEESLVFQLEAADAGRVNFVDVLLAINTWASSATSEARSVTQLNSILATLETETGTILDTHGVRLVEERYCSLGPLGRLGAGRLYPEALRPSRNTNRYRKGEAPSEKVFQLDLPAEVLERLDTSGMERLPPPDPQS